MAARSKAWNVFGRLGTEIMDYKYTFFFKLFGLWGYWLYGHYCPIVPASGDSVDDCGEADGM
jgi:hypothetical protein